MNWSRFIPGYLLRAFNKKERKMTCTTKPAFKAPDGAVVTTAGSSDYPSRPVVVNHPKLGPIVIGDDKLTPTILEPAEGAVQVGKYLALRVHNRTGKCWRLNYPTSAGEDLVTWDRLCELGTPVPLVVAKPAATQTRFENFSVSGSGGGSLRVERSWRGDGGGFLRAKNGSTADGWVWLDRESTREVGEALIAIASE